MAATQGAGARLDSWKGIAAYLKRDVRTVQRWETSEGLPVHRHVHQQRSSVYAFTGELDFWWAGRKAVLEGLPNNGAAKPRRLAPRLAAAVVVLLTVGIAAWSFLSRRSAKEPIRSYPLTSALGVETGPDFSPDGSKIAYAWRKESDKYSDIYVKKLGVGDPLQLTKTPDAGERLPAWSPDGNWVAFLGTRDGGSRLLVVPSTGGPERRIGEREGPGQGFCWSPDGRTIIAPYREGQEGLYALYAVSVATGEKRKLIQPPPGDADIYPSVSSDGRTLAFVRTSNFGMARRVFLAALSPSMTVVGEPAPSNQVTGSIESVSWIKNERTLAYLSGCCASGTTVGFWIVRVDSPNASRLLLPISGMQAVQGRLSPDGARAAYYSIQSGGPGFWRLDLKQGAVTEGIPREIPSSTATNLNPNMSPDGQSFAFVSSRSGSLEIWTSSIDGSRPNQITRTTGAKNGSPRWSPDGRRIAFNSSIGPDTDIYIVNSDGGEPARLTTHAAVDHDPSWSADGKWIYFSSIRTGRDEIWKIPAAGGPEVQITRKGGFGGFESPDGRHFYYTTAYIRGELRRVPAGGGIEETLVPQIHGVHELRVTRSGVYFLDSCPDCEKLGQPHVLKRYRFSDGQIEDEARFRLPVRMGFAVAPDESFVIVNAYRDTRANPVNITIVEGLR